jgi:predicted GNAT family N-acyltransferase
VNNAARIHCNVVAEGATMLNRLPGKAREEAAHEMAALATRWPMSALRTGRRDVTFARSARELSAIGRVRYDLYVSRDHKAYPTADHVNRSLIEPVDPTSLNFYASEDETISAAVRLTRSVDADRDALMQRMIVTMRARRLGQLVICSRFVCLPALQARRMIAPLFQEVYRAGLCSGAMRCALITRPSLRGIFEKFGFKTTGCSFIDAVAGEMEILELDLFNYEHFIAIGSPLLEIFTERFQVDTADRLPLLESSP